MLRISARELARVSAHCAAAFPEEACGLLLGRIVGDVTEAMRARPCANVAAERSRAFAIAPQEFLDATAEAERAGEEVVGVYHAHPNGDARPTETDRAAAWPGLVHVIVAVAQAQPGEVAAWVLAADKAGFRREAMVQVA